MSNIRSSSNCAAVERGIVEVVWEEGNERFSAVGELGNAVVGRESRSCGGSVGSDDDVECERVGRVEDRVDRAYETGKSGELVWEGIGEEQW